MSDLPITSAPLAARDRDGLARIGRTVHDLRGIRFGNDDDGNKPAGGEPKSFTQDQVNALLAEQKRKDTAKFADYDDLKAAKTELDKLREESKTELQKALDRATAAESKVASFEAKEQAQQWAGEIVKGSEIPASVLRGSTREEMQAHFDQLKELAPKPPKRTSVPSGKPAGGDTGSRAVAALRELRGQG